MRDEAALDALDFRVMYREGQNRRVSQFRENYQVFAVRQGEETFTPRVLIFDDRRGGFGGVRRENELYTLQSDEQQMDAQRSWSGGVEVLKQDAHASNPFLDSLRSGTFEQGELMHLPSDPAWPDYNRSYFHPRSAVHCDAGEHYAIGYAHANTDAFYDEYYDGAFRYFLEEADCVDGMRVSCDLLNGYGGVCTRLLQWCRDDLPKTPVLAFGMHETEPSLDAEAIGNRKLIMDRVRMNVALATHTLLELTEMYVPLDVDAVVKNFSECQHLMPPRTRYESSALVSAAIDTTLMPSCLRRNADRIGFLSCLMKTRQTFDTMAHLALEFGGKSMQPLSRVPIQSVQSMYISLRGGTSITQFEIEQQFARRFQCRMLKANVLPLAFPVRTPFPPLITTSYYDHAVQDKVPSLRELDVECSAMLYATPESCKYVEKIIKSVKNVNQLYDRDEVQAVTQYLTAFTDTYSYED